MDEGTYRVAAICIWAIGVIVNALVLIAAIYGPKYHETRRRPNLQIALKNTVGVGYESTSKMAKVEQRRVYHLKVWNEQGKDAAEGVRIYMTKLVRKLDEEAFVYEEGPIPLQWQFGKQLNDLQNNKWNIGREMICDLVRVRETVGLEVCLCFPTGTLRDMHKLPHGKNSSIQATFVAAGDNGESKELELEIIYNGEWSTDDSVMSQNIQIREVT